MKLETFTTNVNEVYVTTGNESFAVTATTWSNQEGINVMLHGKNLDLRGSFSLRWEDLDVLQVALQAARAV
jgi:hypothetical protein